VWDNEGDGDEEVEIEVGETAEIGDVGGSVAWYRNPWTVSIRMKRYGDSTHGEIV
jgi:hypothetical protein